MNDDSISREALRRRMYHEAFEVDNGMQRWDSGLWIRYKIFENAIEEAPTVEPERKHGKWKVCSILDYKQRPTGRYVGLCPFCEFLTGEFRTLIEGNRELTNFCPNCGAELEADNGLDPGRL